MTAEAIRLLQRASGAYASEIRIANRRIEKAEPGSDEARAAQQRRDTLTGLRQEVGEALTLLGGAPPPEPDDG